MQAETTANYITPSGRDLRIDLMRGYFILIMIVDHIAGFSPFYYITGGAKFYTTGAEGFILISGLMIGMVYKPLMQKLGLRAGVIKALKRTVTLYLVSVAITLVTVFFAEHLHLGWSKGISMGRPLEWISQVFLLNQKYSYVDIIALYALFFCLVPLALYLLYHNKTGWLLAITWGVYTAYQIFPQALAFPRTMFINFTGGQVIFFTGMVMGYHRDRIPFLIRPVKTRWMAVCGVVFALLVLLFAYIQLPNLLPVELFSEDALRILRKVVFLKQTMGIGRLVASAAVFGFMFFAITRWWDLIKAKLGWLLLPFGQKALYAYTVHLGAIILGSVMVKTVGIRPAPQLLSMTLQALGVALVWFLTHRQVLAPNDATRKFWYASPFLIAFGIYAVETIYRLPAVFNLLH